MNRRIKHLKKIGWIFFVLFATASSAKIKLPAFIGNNMVLQRDKPVAIWGWAKSGEQITITLEGNETHKSITGNDGIWRTVLNSRGAGGPYTIEIKSFDDSLIIKNILFGDVWICSGQSNMAFEVKKVNNAKKEIEDANYPSIRLLQVGRKGSQKAEMDIPSGTWKECNPSSIENFSAVAYFFGRNVLTNTKVPIGLVDVSWGGSIIEAWLSTEVLSKYPTKLPLVKKIEDNPNYMNDKVNELSLAGKVWLKKFYTETGQIDSTAKLINPPSNENWKAVNLPAFIDDQNIPVKPGISWYRKNFQISESPENKKWLLSLGSITDVSLIYLNGQKVSESLSRYVDNNIAVPASLLKTGKNELLVYSINEAGKTGFWGEKPLQIKDLSTDKIISLAGAWSYKQQAVHSGKTLLGNRPSTMFEQGDYALIYNAMVSPLTQLSVKGALWYQGESNANKPDEYEFLLKDLINSWRTAWGFSNMPFYIVQLPNYDKLIEKQKAMAWPRLQEVQKDVAFSLKNSGLATTYDIGEADNLHPKNKQDVGKRLALIARKELYKEDQLVCYGPIFKSAESVNDSLIISFLPSASPFFNRTGSKTLNNFKVAGNDKVFYPAIAFISGQKVIAYSPKVAKPVYVRYAFDCSPTDVNFYNKGGLPAIPFRTDNLKEW